MDARPQIGTLAGDAQPPVAAASGEQYGQSAVLTAISRLDTMIIVTAEKANDLLSLQYLHPKPFGLPA